MSISSPSKRGGANRYASMSQLSSLESLFESVTGQSFGALRYVGADVQDL
jgi:hypothetical protein